MHHKYIKQINYKLHKMYICQFIVLMVQQIQFKEMQIGYFNIVVQVNHYLIHLIQLVLMDYYIL